MVEGFVKAAGRIWAGSKRPVAPLDQVGAFNTLEFDCVDNDTAEKLGDPKGGLMVNAIGYGLIFLKRGSHPGVVLQLEVGGAVKSFAPGDRFDGYFEKFKLFFNDNSAIGQQEAPIRFAVLQHPQANLIEAADATPERPIDLLGTFDPNGYPTNYVTLTEDTPPDGSTTFASTGVIEVKGFKYLRIFIDGDSAGGNATSFDLVPWACSTRSFVDTALASYKWHEQSDARISVPDSSPSGGQYRMVTVPVVGDWLMYFEIENLLAAGRTGLRFAVQGLR